MKQILHIFKKDVRRFLPEILIVLSLVAGCASIYYYLSATDPQFRSGDIYASGKLARMIPLFIFFISFAWILLVCRVIQAERLAGDTQFWITRPYEWKKLLTAKLLFIVTFIYLPSIAAFSILRIEQGLLPHANLARGLLGGLGNFLYGITVLVLSAAAIATVTSSIARMMGGILCAYGSVIGVVIVTYLMRPDSASGPLSEGICWVLTLLICAAVVVLQYARRRTRTSIALLVAIPVLICAISIFTPERLPRERTPPPKATGTAAPLR